jgi:hypothetical protein
VADGGSLTFPSFDGVARPYPRSSGPKDGFSSFPVLSSRSSPGPIASGGGGLVHAMIASSSRVDLKRAEIRALWPPMYRGFGHISKRIRSRSCFDPSIKLIYALVGINLKGKNS